MPNFDGTGPNGLGPKDGKKMGKCEASQNQERRRCFGFRQENNQMKKAFDETLSIQEQLETLKSYKKKLEERIEALEKEVK